MNYQYWLGTEASFESAQATMKMVAEGRLAGRWDASPAKTDLPPLWQKVGSTAVMNIKGSLINGSAGWGQLFGVLGYADIANAVAEISADPEVKQIMFHITSPGGEVAGVADLGNLLGAVSKAKPSAAHGSSLVGSAGYWLMSSINGLKTAGPTAEIGSIGVLQIAMERSKQLADAGVTVKVLRSVPMKARMNAYEPLSSEAEAYALEQLGQLHDMFVAQVQAGRPNLTAKQLETATDGRTFLGQAAVKAGLVDRVANFEQALKLLDKNSVKKDTSSNSKGAAMKITLNETQVAAIAAGATLESLGFSAEQIAAHHEAVRAETAAAAADDKGQAAALAAANEAAAKAAAEAAAKLAANPAAAPPDVTAQLIAQVTAKTEEATRLAAENATLKAKMTAMEATHSGLLALAREGITKMYIPMGGSKDAAAAMDAATVIAEYPKAKAAFEAAFPIGGAAAAAAKTDDKNTKVQVSPQFEQLARAAAARAAK